MVFRVCFLGGARYSRPLDKTADKKFGTLATLADISAIGFSTDARPRHFTQQARFYLLPSLPLPVLRYCEVFTIGMLVALWSVMRHHTYILVAQSPHEGFAAAWAKIIVSWLGRKVVLIVESHGDFEESLFLQRATRLPGLYRSLMHYTACFALRHADLLRAISRSTSRQLERWAPGKPLLQFPTWTDIEIFLQAGLSEKVSSFQDILYAGVLITRKGVHHLVNAFAHIEKDFPKARLVIIGHEENKAYAAELKKLVRQLGLDRRILFIEQVPQAELAAWMREACIFVLPSVSEGLGRVVIEAMATGTPVIGSDVGGIPDMVEEGVTGFLVQPGDEKALAEKMRWVLEHLDKAGDMGRCARAFAERSFSTEAYLQGYRQVFEVAQTLLAGQDEHAHSPL